MSKVIMLYYQMTESLITNKKHNKYFRLKNKNVRSKYTTVNGGSQGI